MSKATRMHISPGVLVTALGVVAALALMAAVVWLPGPGPAQAQRMGRTPPFGGTPTPTMDPATPTPTPTPTPTMPASVADGSACDAFDTPMPRMTWLPWPLQPARSPTATSGSGSPEIQLIIESLEEPVKVGSSIVLYLEDDYAEPSSISASSVYLVVTGGETSTTGDGGRVYVTNTAKIKTGAYFDADKKDISIRVLIPDMCPDSTDGCEGQDGLQAEQMVTLVVESDSGIKNPSEAGSHSTGYAILGPTDKIPSKATATGDPYDVAMKLNDLKTERKITLFDVDNKRGFEQTVMGTGFKDGTTASVYVLHIMGTEPGNAMRNAYLWNALDCDEMNDAIGLMDADRAAEMTSPCVPYGTSLLPAHKTAIDGAKFFSEGPGEAALCAAIIRDGTNVGGALVGSNDKVDVTFEVTAPTFGPGQTNHICMADGTGKASVTDVEDFNLQPSIKVVPSSANSGDTVNVFAQDYSNENAGFAQLKIAGQVIPNGPSPAPNFIRNMNPIGSDGSGTVTFEVPGGYEGTLRIDARWGPLDADDKCKAAKGCISKDSKITIAGAQLNVSKTEALPNETITITGNGFGSQSCIPVGNIVLDNAAVIVDDDSEANSGDCDGMIEVSNSGQFVATIILWQARSGTNPVLIPRHPRAERGG